MNNNSAGNLNDKARILEDYSFFKIIGEQKDFEIIIYKNDYYKAGLNASNKITKEEALELSKSANCTSLKLIKELIENLNK